MTLLSFAAMYVLMYAMVDRFGNVFNNVNQVYMAGLMAAAMVLIELARRRLSPSGSEFAPKARWATSSSCAGWSGTMPAQSDVREGGDPGRRNPRNEGEARRASMMMVIRMHHRVPAPPHDQPAIDWESGYRGHG